MILQLEISIQMGSSQLILFNIMEMHEYFKINFLVRNADRFIVSNSFSVSDVAKG